MRKKLYAVCLCAAVFLTGCGLQNERSASQDANVSQPDVQEETASAKIPVSTAYINSGNDAYAALLQAPDENATSVARMYTGDKIDIYGLQGMWYEVQYGDLSGYVSGAYITFNEPVMTAEAPAPAVTEAPAPAAEAAAPAAEQAAQPPVNITNNQVTTVELKFDAAGIALPSSYVDYVEYQGDDRNGYCNATSCYIYKTASYDGPKREADMLYKGDAVTIYGTYGGFYYIGTDGGSGYDLTGYVPTKYITKGTPPSAQGKSYSATQGYVDVKSCNVRSTPDKSTDNNIIDTITSGTTFTINSFDGYWYYINYYNGSGYVSYKMVTVY